MARSNAGGGYGSSVVTERPVRTGSGARAIGPGGVSQLGNKVGSHVTRGQDSDYRGDAFNIGRGYNPVPYGNEKALDVGGGGCGTGRTIYSSGSQSGGAGHGPSNPGDPRSVPSRHVIESYGPDYRRPGNPHRRSSDIDADES